MPRCNKDAEEKDALLRCSSRRFACARAAPCDAKPHIGLLPVTVLCTVRATQLDSLR
uniref:Uncharacterized protein n=1 Tax=Hyaloperonospora arabidopsidis (strain Emoy2) TaxID=559515 RepID=M4BUA8_HYAAE